MSSDTSDLFNLLPELLSLVGGFLSGKALSTFALATATSNNALAKRDLVLYTLIVIVFQRCSAFLNEGCPPALQECWKLLSANFVAQAKDGVMEIRTLSEWCAVVDYCERCPGILSDFYQESYNDNAKPAEKCWLLGGGMVTPRLGHLHIDQHEPLQTTQAVFSSPKWEPQLLVMAEKWFAPQVHMVPVFWGALSAGEYSFSTAVGLVSWRDENALRLAHRQMDLDGGLIAEHRTSRPISRFSWLTKATRELYPVDRLLEAEGFEWLEKIATPYDNHMLCTWEVEGGGSVTVLPAQFVNNGLFVSKVLKLLVMLDNLW